MDISHALCKFHLPDSATLRLQKLFAAMQPALEWSLGLHVRMRQLKLVQQMFESTLKKSHELPHADLSQD